MLRGAKMKIYPQEIRDGVADAVQASASVAYCSPASVSTTISNHSVAFAETVKAQSANPKQIDLYYIKSILVSTGWNKNDDVFDPSQTWAARNTPEDKQFNFMHNENDIIGHITGSYVVEKNGQLISSDTQPEDFDIITEAVLYNSWTNPENRERMTQIIAEIENGKWFVSMECLFAGFDYALVDNNGDAKKLERNEGSAFLTKHLRAYGGTGEYEGYKVGRLLRDISFSGKGLVSKPANPRSVILDSSRAFHATSDSNLTSFPKGDDNMSDLNLLEKQLAEVRSELASAKEENKTLRDQLEALASKEHVDSIAKLEAAIAEQDEVVKNLQASLAEKETLLSQLHETVAMKDGEMKKKDEELMNMKKKEKMSMRKASLIEAGFEDAEAEESLIAYDALSDEAFETVLAAMKKKMAKWQEEKMKKEEKSKSEDTTVTASEEAPAEEIFEGVSVTEATLVDASNDTDELVATRASVAEWLEKNVLRK
jgi:uncharacterized coiled-coil protein SlyX